MICMYYRSGLFYLEIQGIMQGLAKEFSMKLSKQLQIFLLYARGDKEAVRRLYQRIVREGANVWLDREKILPGQDWQYEIRRAIHGSDLVIVCLSRRFNKQGGYRHEELRIALKKVSAMPEGRIFIIPARLEQCDMPESLRRWQRVDLFEARGYEKLMDAIRRFIVLM
jgi:hypothetical protein